MFYKCIIGIRKKNKGKKFGSTIILIFAEFCPINGGKTNYKINLNDIYRT